MDSSGDKLGGDRWTIHDDRFERARNVSHATIFHVAGAVGELLRASASV
jgi:hypothetical protein